jgi:hypothetical protein
MTCVGLEMLAAVRTAGTFVNIDCFLYFKPMQGTVLRAPSPALYESSDVIGLAYHVTMNKTAALTGSTLNRQYFESRTWRRKDSLFSRKSVESILISGMWGPTFGQQNCLTVACGQLVTEFR